MGFVSINELQNFSYKDSYITEADFSNHTIVLEVNALIVRSENSQNSNFTDSYCDVAILRVENYSIVKLTKLGYRKYDANDKLIEEVADEEIAYAVVNLKELFTKSFITAVVKKENGAVLRIELPDEDPSAITEEYELEITCGDIKISWDRYLNRVQEY